TLDGEERGPLPLRRLELGPSSVMSLSCLRLFPDLERLCLQSLCDEEADLLASVPLLRRLVIEVGCSCTSLRFLRYLPRLRLLALMGSWRLDRSSVRDLCQRP